MYEVAVAAEARRLQHGFTLVEVIIAAALLTIVSVGVLSLFIVAAARNSDRGDQATRTTEYAADKLEQLMALQFSDITSDLTVTPTCNSLNGCTPSLINGKGLTAPGGNIDPSNVTATGYFDYLDGTSGIPSTTRPGYGYLRQWTIVLSSATLKTITVQVTTIGSVSKIAPVTTLICQKANY